MSRRAKWILILLVVFLVFDAAAVIVITMARRPSSVATTWKTVTTGRATIGGPFTLTTADGKIVTDQTYRGKWMLIYFGYTFCPDACPTALNNIGIALQKLGKEVDKIQPLFITVDPKRDTREVMSAYLESFDSHIVGLLGTQEQTEAAAKAYRVYVEPEKSEGDDYLVSHSSYLYLMDLQGKFVDAISGATAGDELGDKLHKLINEHST